MHNSQLEQGCLPAVGTHIVEGAFVVVDLQLRDDHKPQSINGSPEKPSSIQDPSQQGCNNGNSFVDIAYGRNTSTFSGCHRFEVQRVGRLTETSNLVDSDQSATKADIGIPQHDENTLSGQNIFEGVRLIYSSFACDPINRERRFPALLHYFHILYARWLLWDGVRQVLTLQ
jgi:hypothetical protein